MRNLKDILFLGRGGVFVCRALWALGSIANMGRRQIGVLN